MTESPRTWARTTRRGFLRAALGGALLPMLPGRARASDEELPPPWREGSTLDRLIPQIDPFLDLFNAHTDERVAVRFFDGASYDRRAVQDLNWIFRDWRQEEAPQIDPRLFWGLAAISNAAKKDGHTGLITLLSGFRTRATNDMLRAQGVGAASNSYHLRRQAADIRLESVPMATVADYAEWLQVGGVGRYPGSNFTHVDSGPIRTW